jgi:hypothetical protein
MDSIKMKTLIVLFTAILLSACGSTKKANVVDAAPITSINSQKLETTFKRSGVKLEWTCAWGTGLFDATCVKGEVKAIEVTGYAPSFGNSEALRENAFISAEMSAKEKLIRFIKTDISTSRVSNTMAKNVELANDRIKHRITGEEVAMSDTDAEKDTNFAVRTNTNEIVRNVTTTIQTQASGILRGIRVVDEKVVDRQTVAVTIRWDKDSEKATEYLQKKFR